MDFRLVLVLLLVFASVEVLGRKKGRKNRRRWPRRFPKPYRWMHYSSNYDPTIEENGCVDIRPQCSKWAQFPGYCRYARGYMIRHCKKSCRLCRAEDEVSIGKTSGVDNSYVNEICEDRLEDCQTYIKSQSQCDLFRGLMKKYCRKTCGFCCFDILTDCSVFIKKPSQCKGLNGFFRRYCPNTCQMCGLLLPTKKPGCQDELDDCRAFNLEQCQIHKSFCSKYCAKTCGFCEDQGHSPPGTTQPFVHQQHTDGLTNNETTREVSASTPQGVTGGIYQDAVNTRGTREDKHQQETATPAVTTTSPADSGISPETTEAPHKVTTLPDSKKDESATTAANIAKTTTSDTKEISYKETTLSDSKKDEPATTGSKTEKTATDEILEPQTTAPSLTTESINTSKLSTSNEDTSTNPPKTTSSFEIKTETEPTDVNEKQTTSLPTESTKTRTSKTTEATFLTAETTTAQALEKSTTESSSEETKTNSSDTIIEVISHTTDSPDLAASTPTSKTENEFPTTGERTASDSHTILAQASSPKVQSSTNSPETTTQPEITTDRASTVKSTSVANDTQDAKETTAPSVLDRIPAASSTARSTTGNLDIGTLSPSPRVTTGIPNTARTDSYASSPSTAKLAPDFSSPVTGADPSLNTGSPDSEVLSTGDPKPDLEVITSGKGTEQPTTAEQSTAKYSPTTTITEKPSIESPSTVAKNPDVVVDGFGQGNPTKETIVKKEQNIDAVVRTTRGPTTMRSHLRSKTGKKPVCVDKLKECASYVKENINYCKYHVHFMHEYCSKSCRFCGHDKLPIPKCEDMNNKCQYFSKFVGYCTVNRKYMKRRCPKSCGFCSVAPGSLPMDRTFVRTDQNYEFSIVTQWDGTPITHAPIKFKLSAEDNTNVRLEVSGPLFNQPGPPPCVSGQPCWQLWNYEVAEMFFLGEKEKYLELEVSPHGPHLLLLLDGVRKPFKTKLPMRYSATKDLSSMTWNGTAIIPLDYFPPGMRKINAYAIHGPDHNKIYESLYPASNTAYPDFHRLDFFKDFDFKSMFPSGWNQPISPLWIRSK